MADSARKSTRTLALLASSTPLGEADALLSFFTPEAGAQLVRARGLRRAQSKLAHLLKPADELRLTLAAGRMATPLLTGVSVEQAHPMWQAELRYLALYWYMLECAQLGSASPQLNTAVFTLLVNLLRSQPEPAGLFGVASVFALRLLGLHGLLPDLQHCALDGHRFTLNEPLHLLPSGEGLIGREAYNQHYARSGGGLLRLAPGQLTRWGQLAAGGLLDYPQAAANADDAAILVYLATQRMSDLAARPMQTAAFLSAQWKLAGYTEMLRQQRD